MPNRRKTNKETDIQITDMYIAGNSVAEISKYLNTGSSVVSRAIHESGMAMRDSMESLSLKYPRNKYCFDIVTPESAYWVGFLMADGCVSDDGTITLSLQSQDKSHVEKFKKFIGSNNKIGEVLKKSLKTGKNTSAIQFRVMDKYMANSLNQLGVIPRKTDLAVAHPSLVNNRDFWRGMIDGDGSIYIHQSEKYKGSIALDFCGSYEIVEQWKEFIRRKIPDFNNTIVRHKNAKNNYSLVVNNSKAITMIYLLYTNCIVALDRKLQKAFDILNGELL